MEVAIDEHDGPTRHSLYGTLAIGNAKYEVVADYYIKQENGKMLFLSGSVANQTLKREYFTSRSNFDGAGFPWTWSFKLAAPEIGEEYTDISFKKVEYPASFSPAQVYKVPDPKSHEKFTIVDISLKEPNVLHRPPAFKKVKRFDGLSSKTIIFGGMTFFTAIALWFLLKAPRKTAA